MTRAEAEQAIAAGEDARRVVSILDELDAGSTRTMMSEPTMTEIVDAVEALARKIHDERDGEALAALRQVLDRMSGAVSIRVREVAVLPEFRPADMDTAAEKRRSTEWFKTARASAVQLDRGRP